MLTHRPSMAYGRYHGEKRTSEDVAPAADGPCCREDVRPRTPPQDRRKKCEL